MPDAPINQFGRRGGRGWRPWALLPKVVAVGFYIGGLAASLAFWLSSGFSALAPGDPLRLWIINQFSRLMEFFVVPSLLAALVFGIILLLQHPRIFIRMRWLAVKLVILAMLIPAAHLFVSSRIARLRDAAVHGLPDPAAATQVVWGLCLILAVSLCVVVLGRLKPRLGQNWARAYRTTT
jgi:hypothetical protein